MRYGILGSLDRTSARSAFLGNTASVVGVVGTLVLVGLMLWLYVPEFISYLTGKYYQSNFEVQQSIFTRVNIPKAFRTAIVFTNNTDLRTANHTLLSQLATFQAYLTQGSTQKFEAVQ